MTTTTTTMTPAVVANLVLDTFQKEITKSLEWVVTDFKILNR